MSRHEIEGSVPGAKVVVGWDQPLLTYFLHVTYPDRDYEGPHTWLGSTFRELYDLEDLKFLARRYADLTPDLLAQLYRDQDEGI